jgi:hypothetical protein
MIKCAAYASKKSNDQCKTRALSGTKFCGKHNRAKFVRLWLYEDINTLPAITIQRIWKGYFIRKLNKLSGPGVLSRKQCHNDEELVTFDEKDKVHPSDYFAFEENSLIYWFSLKTILTLALSNPIPTNPYTRQPFSQETMQRLREKIRLDTFIFRKVDGITSYDNYSNNYWMVISQIMKENGFDDLHLHVDTLRRPGKLYTFLILFFRDLFSWVNQKPDFVRGSRYTFQLKMILIEFCKKPLLHKMIHISYSTFLDIMLDSRCNYDICFMFMSALYRL